MMARAMAYSEGPVDPRAVRLVRKTVTVALRDAINAARRVAIDRALPSIARALDQEAYFDDGGARRALPRNNPAYTAWKVAQGWDKRRAHKTGALQKGIGDRRAVKREEVGKRSGTKGRGESVQLAFRYLQPILKRIAHIAQYRANKAPIGQPSSGDAKRMADAAAKAYADRMNTALRAGGFTERVRLTKGGEVVGR